MVGMTPVRRSTRLQTASQSAGPSGIGGTPAPSVAEGSRKTPLPKAKARKSNAYGANTRLADADELGVPDTGFAQGLDAQLDHAISRDDVAPVDDGHDGSVDQALQELAAPSTRFNKQSRTQFRVTYQNEADITPSAASSFMDTSKSFGLDRESGMRPGVDGRLNGISQVFRHSVERPAAPLFAGSSTVRGRPAERAQRPMPPLFNASSTAYRHQLGQTPALRRGQLANEHAHPTNVQPNYYHGSLHGSNGTTGTDMRENRDSWIYKIAAFFDNTINGRGGIKFKSFFKAFLYVLFGFALVVAVDWFLQMTALGVAIRARAVYTWYGASNMIHPLGPGYCDQPIDRHGRSPGIPGYKPIWDRMWDVENAVDKFEKNVMPAVHKMEKETQEMEKYNAKMEHSLEALQQYLPPAVLVIRHPDNSLEIPDEFWRALVSKMRQEGLEGPVGSGVSDWNEFLEKNRANILNFMRDEIKASPAGLTLKIIEQPEFIRLMNQEYNKISALVDKKIEDAVKTMSKTVAKEVANSAFLDQVRIESLALTNLIANTEINLRKVNYFSPGLGARIDPYQTSSTLDIGTKKPSRILWLYKKLFSRHHRGPLTALEKWDEAGECWCASKDEKGRGLAQLSVSLGVEMIPRQVTIDHLPKEASLDIGSAPKRMELWAESDEKWSAAQDCGPGEEGLICLGSFSYNIHADNHVQTFNLDAVLTRPVRKAFVRVTDNWGADHTCLYRVRLHGDRAPQEDVE
jgi:SUN domain-containing protein 1/2